MELLPLELIGWLYSVGAGIALAVGAWLIVGMHFSGTEARKQLALRVLDDSLLFGIWILGLPGASASCSKSPGAGRCWSCSAGR